jgi:hypothetical protein
VIEQSFGMDSRMARHHLPHQTLVGRVEDWRGIS